MAAWWPGEEWMFDEGRYAPEHDTDPPRPVPAVPLVVGGHEFRIVSCSVDFETHGGTALTDTGHLIWLSREAMMIVLKGFRALKESGP